MSIYKMSFANNVVKTTPKLEVWSMEDKGTLYVSEALMHEIEYLHRHVGPIEWCGPLLYERLAGSLEAPSTLSIRAHHVFPMDIGSPGYTTATLSAEDMCDLYEQYPQLTEGTWKQGLIHTHHNMSTFFSGTDMDELQDNTPNHNYYLSLIVNFSGVWCAKVAFVATLKQHSENNFYFKGVEDEEATFGRGTDYEKQVLMTIDMNIVKEGSDIISQEFKARFQRLKEEQARKRSAYTPAYGTGASVYSSGTQGVYTGPKTPQTQEAAQGGAAYKGKHSMEQGELYQGTSASRQQRQDPTLQTSIEGQNAPLWQGNFGDGFAGERANQETETATTSGLKSIQKGKIASMTDVHSAQLCLQWMHQGAIEELQLNKANFKTIRDALEYYEQAFIFDEDAYKFWLGEMQKELHDICKGYEPAVIEVRMARNFEFFLQRFNVARDLYNICDNYQGYVNTLEDDDK